MRKRLTPRIPCISSIREEIYVMIECYVNKAIDKISASHCIYSMHCGCAHMLYCSKFIIYIYWILLYMDKLLVDVAIDKLPEMKVLKTKQILQMFIISIKITSKNFELDTSFLMYFSYRIYSLNTFFLS